MSENPFDSTQYQPRSGGSKAWMWILAIIGGGGLLMILLCCGGGVGLVGFGMNMVEEELKTELRDDPQVQEHIGEITKLDVNYMKSAASDDEDVFVYDIEGSKGSGELTVDTNDGVNGDIESASIRLSGGDVIELDLGFSDVEAEFDFGEDEEP